MQEGSPLSCEQSERRRRGEGGEVKTKVMCKKGVSPDKVIDPDMVGRRKEEGLKNIEGRRGCPPP